MLADYELRLARHELQTRIEREVAPRELPPAFRFDAARRQKNAAASLTRLDGLILAETSVAGITLLVTADKHLLDIDEADLPSVRAIHPKRLLWALR